jgi:hypothetical protein
MSGKTEYDFNLVQEFILLSGDTIAIGTRSLLEFPLDAVLVGGTIGINLATEEKTIGTVEFGLYTNMNDPGGLMKDHDWIAYPGVFDGKISYTESEAKMEMLLFSFQGTVRLFDLGGASISFLGGYNYQKIEQSIIGFTGWFIDSNLTQQPQSGTEPAIDYRVTYKGPKFGISIQEDFGQRIQLNVQSGLSLIWADDFDDHLLRKFHTFADGDGSGTFARAGLRLNLSRGSGGMQSFIDFIGSYDYISVSAKQTFEQYADGGPNENPVGTSFGGLPHDFKSSQYRFGASLGLEF